MASNSRIITPNKGYTTRVDLRCPQIGIVKDTTDPENMGRLKVWIVGSTTLETDPSGWITCNYSSPFAGATDPLLCGNDAKDPDGTQESYGFWGIPPDINNQVIVQFINADLSKAYWTGCLFQKDMNYMIPGTAAGNSYQNAQYPNGSLVPVLEYNKQASTTATAKQSPYYQTLADGLKLQGLITDPLRGAGNASARRESPSQVFGMKTPGGNTFTMDDGDGNELIRLRTASGAQILISETEGNVYIISRDGNNWIELNNDGNIDVYSGTGINFNVTGDYNIRATGNVNIEAGGNVNVKGGSSVNLQAATDNVNISVANDLDIAVGTNWNQTVQGTITTWHADGAAVVSDDYSHPSSVNDDLPEQPSTPTIYQQSIKDANGVEVPTKSICDRVPDAEPWPLHAQSGVVALPTPQAGPSNVSIGSVIPNATQPLPLIGTPQSGMQRGIYTPNGYTSKGQPQYTYEGPTTALIPVNQLSISQAGLDFIKHYEGTGLPGRPGLPYPDASGLAFDVGYAHTIVPTDSDHIKTGPLTIDEMDELLKQDIVHFEAGVRRLVTVPLTQAQFDVLCDFAYDLGLGKVGGKHGLASTSFLKELNAGNYAAVPSGLSLYVYSAHKVLPALVARRRAEGLLFAQPASEA